MEKLNINFEKDQVLKAEQLNQMVAYIEDLENRIAMLEAKEIPTQQEGFNSKL